MKWAVIDGRVEIADSTATFKGEPATFTTDKGEEVTGGSVGLAMTSARFSNGEISATVEFDKVSDRNACEIIFYYDAPRRWHVAAGIGGDRMYIVRHWDGKWVVHAIGGSRANLEAKRPYHMKVRVRGSRVLLLVDDVEVLGAVLPFPLTPSQAGLWFLDDSDVRVTDFRVTNQRARVFVVMQFSSPFTELYGVIKKVCEEFHLDTHRADETYGPGFIVRDIARDITESEFVIAEITPANPNVYYELGYAHAIDKQAILLAERQLQRPPFDVAPFRIMFYENSIAGRQAFEDHLRKHIEAILEKGELKRR